MAPGAAPAAQLALVALLGTLLPGESGVRAAVEPAFGIRGAP